VRFVVVGAGAVGGAIGGRLHEHGHEVVLVARGAHYEALSAHGLRIESAAGSTTLAVPTVSRPTDLTFGGGDVVVLAVKSQDTAAVLDDLVAVVPPTVPVVCAQNGVENERVALRSFPNVYGMCVMCPVSHLTPGVVQVHSVPITGLLDLGRWPQGSDQVAESIAAALAASTFDAVARSDIPRWKWGKLLLNLGNAVEALCGPAARGGELAPRARREAIACLEVAGIDYVGREEEAERRGTLLQLPSSPEVSRAGGSTWQSLARSSGRVETDFLNGEIVLLGRLHGVPTPVNALLQTLTNRQAREHGAPAGYTEADLLGLLA
jgi:2-dehydropantoate 2-reductase